MYIETVNDVITSRILSSDKHLLFQTNVSETRFYELYSYLRCYYVRVTSIEKNVSRFFKLILTAKEKELSKGYYAILSLVDLKFFC